MSLTNNGQISHGATNGGLSVNEHCLSRKHVVESILESLDRLDLDYVDIICAPRPDPHTPMEETVRAFNYIIDKGLAFYWGTSMWSADEILEACRIAKTSNLIAPIVEQPVYNLLDRQKVEGEFHRVYSRSRIGLTVGAPLKGGILASKRRPPPTQPHNGTRAPDTRDCDKILSNGETCSAQESRAYTRKIERLKVNNPNHCPTRCVFAKSIFLAPIRGSWGKIITPRIGLVLDEQTCGLGDHCSIASRPSSG